jgi:hypothetical protein
MAINSETLCAITANKIVRCVPNLKAISHHHLQEMKKNSVLMYII